MVMVLFFAQLREQLQCDKLPVVVAAPISINDLRAEILLQHPHWTAFLSSDSLLCAVNQTLVKTSHLVNDGDEVAFFPPVTGG